MNQLAHSESIKMVLLAFRKLPVNEKKPFIVLGYIHFIFIIFDIVVLSLTNELILHLISWTGVGFHGLGFISNGVIGVHRQSEKYKQDKKSWPIRIYQVIWVIHNIVRMGIICILGYKYIECKKCEFYIVQIIQNSLVLLYAIIQLIIRLYTECC